MFLFPYLLPPREISRINLRIKLYLKLEVLVKNPSATLPLSCHDGRAELGSCLKDVNLYLLPAFGGPKAARKQYGLVMLLKFVSWTVLGNFYRITYVFPLA